MIFLLLIAVLFFFFDSLDGLPFQNEEFDFVYVIFTFGSVFFG